MSRVGLTVKSDSGGSCAASKAGGRDKKQNNARDAIHV